MFGLVFLWFSCRRLGCKGEGMLDAGEAIRKLALNVARLSRLAPLADTLIGGVGAILMLHRITARPERPKGVNRHLTICPHFLDTLIGALAADGYRFVSMDEALRRLGGGETGRFAVLTADDAYRDNLTEALPVLEKHGAPMTIYVAPALIDRTAYLWWEVVEEVIDRNESVDVPIAGMAALETRSATQKYAANSWLHDHIGRHLPEADQYAFVRELAARHGIDPAGPSDRALMRWDDVTAAARHPLITLGAHTVNHFNLRRLDEATALAEMKGAADILAERTGQRPRHMAYPYGYAAAVGAREVGLARRAGFASAVTTRHGILRPEHRQHVHALPRISVNGRYQQVSHVRTMLSGVTTPLANAGRVVVTV